eukprot:346254-Pelagomonas_calceolata.AAC.6
MGVMGQCTSLCTDCAQTGIMVTFMSGVPTDLCAQAPCLLAIGSLHLQQSEGMVSRGSGSHMLDCSADGHLFWSCKCAEGGLLGSDGKSSRHSSHDAALYGVPAWITTFSEQLSHEPGSPVRSQLQLKACVIIISRLVLLLHLQVCPCARRRPATVAGFGVWFRFLLPVVCVLHA